LRVLFFWSTLQNSFGASLAWVMLCSCGRGRSRRARRHRREQAKQLLALGVRSLRKTLVCPGDDGELMAGEPHARVQAPRGSHSRRPAPAISTPPDQTSLGLGVHDTRVPLPKPRRDCGMSPNASGPTRRSQQRLAGSRPKPTRSTNKTERWRGFRSSDPTRHRTTRTHQVRLYGAALRAAGSRCRRRISCVSVANLYG
jgi:hypothetical protein